LHRVDRGEGITGAVRKAGGALVKVAVLVGMTPVSQLASLFHTLLKAPVQMASCACAGVTLAPIANNTAKAHARLPIMVAPPLSIHPAVQAGIPAETFGCGQPLLGTEGKNKPDLWDFGHSGRGRSAAARRLAPRRFQ
jgi:hypothetical protein